MRERSIKVDITKLVHLSSLYKGTKVASEIQVSKQMFHYYKTGKRDMPESVLDRLCEVYKLDKSAMIVEAI